MMDRYFITWFGLFLIWLFGEGAQKRKLSCGDVKKAILNNGHAVVVVAEGAGEDILIKESSQFAKPLMKRAVTEGTNIKHQTNAQGVQPKLPPIGQWIKERLKKYLKEKDINDMVLSGLDVQSVVESNVYYGLEANLKFNNWKRA